MKAASVSGTQDAVNRRVYHVPGVERRYTETTLNPAETMALLKHQAAFAGHDVLDLGVGTGRTAHYLAPLARRYEAIDYSPVMIEKVHALLPHVSARLADIRNLSVFNDASFDFVFGANNVMDVFSHEDRLTSLREIHRVLRTAGMLVFSSHNRLVRSDKLQPHIDWSRNPLTLALHALQWAHQVSNRSRLRALYRQEEEYALLSDEGHDHACLHYYIDQAHQRAQLERLGFEVIDVLDRSGRPLDPGEPARESAWLMYVAVAH